MNMARAYLGIIILCVFLICGCSQPEPIPRHNGLVRIGDVDRYPSGSSAEGFLIGSNQMRTSMPSDIKNPEKTGWRSNWESDLQWELVDHHGENDVYRFQLDFTSHGEEVGQNSSRTAKVEYDGRDSVIIFRNECIVVSIEPGTEDHAVKEQEN